MPPRLTLTKPSFARGLFMWMASAISSLPVPLSPVISTEALVLAIRPMVLSTPSNAGDRPIILSNLNFPSISPRLDAGAMSSLRFNASAVSTDLRKALFTQGFVIKSKAPACIPCTASCMLPHAVIRMTGTSGRKMRTWRSSVSPSSPDVLSEKFISIRISSGSVERTTSIASFGPGTASVSYPARFSINVSEERIELSSSIINIIICSCLSK